MIFPLKNALEFIHRSKKKQRFSSLLLKKKGENRTRNLILNFEPTAAIVLKVVLHTIITGIG